MAPHFPIRGRTGLGGSSSVISDLCFSPAVNPCCYYPCQHQGICVRFGLDRYQCDCTRTGYSGPNCTIREPGLLPLLLSWPPLLPWAYLETPLPPISALTSGLRSVLLPRLTLTSDPPPDPATAELSLPAHLVSWLCPHICFWLCSVISPELPSLPCPVCSARFHLGLVSSSCLPPRLLLVLPGGPA